MTMLPLYLHVNQKSIDDDDDDDDVVFEPHFLLKNEEPRKIPIITFIT